MEFKDIIRQLRNERNMNTTQLATQFEKTEAAIRAWESGRSKPDADTLIKLGEYFNCSTDFLLGLSIYRNAAHQHEHRAVLDKAIGKFEDAFNKLDSRSQEELADALTQTIEVLVGLPRHSEQGVKELIRLIGYVGDIYADASKYTADWSDKNLMSLVGACFTYRNNIESTMELMLQDFLIAHIENITDKERRSYLAAMLAGMFPNNDRLNLIMAAGRSNSD